MSTYFLQVKSVGKHVVTVLYNGQLFVLQKQNEKVLFAGLAIVYLKRDKVFSVSTNLTSTQVSTPFRS